MCENKIKRCSTCKELKTVKDFYITRYANGKQRVKASCKVCAREKYKQKARIEVIKRNKLREELLS